VWVFWHYWHKRREDARRRHLAMTMLAPRPEGVRVLRANGEVLDCELVYVGRDNGNHCWAVGGAVLRDGDRLLVDTMPPHTGIEYATSPAD
jgi:hypothetical protein